MGQSPRLMTKQSSLLWDLWLTYLLVFGFAAVIIFHAIILQTATLPATLPAADPAVHPANTTANTCCYASCECLPKGVHFQADLGGCDADLLSDKPFLHRLCIEASTAAGATVLESLSYKFGPASENAGVSILVLLSESHCSMHTYPEEGVAFVDFFGCGPNVQVDQFFAVIRRSLSARSASIHISMRSVNEK